MPRVGRWGLLVLVESLTTSIFLFKFFLLSGELLGSQRVGKKVKGRMDRGNRGRLSKSVEKGRDGKERTPGCAKEWAWWARKAQKREERKAAKKGA